MTCVTPGANVLMVIDALPLTIVTVPMGFAAPLS